MSYKYQGNLPNLKGFDEQQFIDNYKKHCRSHEYQFFTGSWNINLFGIRTPDSSPESFNDLIGVIYQDEHKVYHCKLFKATTELGVKYLKNPVNGLGAGIIAEGQYPSVWKYAKHWGKFKYPMLRQVSTFKVYRDNNKDDVIDLDAETLENNTNGGFQLHKAYHNSYATKIGGISAGCQVIQDPWEYEYLMAILNQSIKVTGYDRFTYTLITNRGIRG